MVPMPNSGVSSRPASNAPTIPTIIFSTIPCCAFVCMMMLASQPRIPPQDLLAHEQLGPFVLHLLVCLNFGLQGRIGPSQLSCPGPHPLFEVYVRPAEHRLIFLLQPLQFLCRNVIDAMETMV